MGRGMLPKGGRNGSKDPPLQRMTTRRIPRSEPMATSKRVTKAAPLRQRFSLEVSSSKGTPRESQPRTRIGRRTEILRSERWLETDVLLGGTMGWVLISGDRRAVTDSGDPDPVGVYPRGGSALFFGDRKAVDKEAFYAREDLAGRSRRVYDSAKLAAVPHAMSKPASELLHFAYTIGQVRSINLAVVVNQ